MEAEHHRRIDGVRHSGPSKQLIAGNGALYFVLVFEVRRQLGVRVELPAAVGCSHSAPAVCAFNVGVHVFTNRGYEEAGVAVESGEKELRRPIG